MYWMVLVATGCVDAGPVSGTHPTTPTFDPSGGRDTDEPADSSEPGPELPLALDAEVGLTGNPVAFDYQDIDAAAGRLVIAHSDDNVVDVVNLADGALVAEIPGINANHGVAVAPEAGMYFVTSWPHTLVSIDATTLSEVAHVSTGKGPDGVSWDPVDQVVGVSDRDDGALSLIADSGTGKRNQVPLGMNTGNVRYDPTRGVFWITVQTAVPPDRLVAVGPVDGAIQASFDLPGCTGAHGMHLHPDAASAFVACEGNDALLRVDLTSGEVLGTGVTGHLPDVLAVDDDLGWLYVAAESGDLAVYDLLEPGVVLVGHDSPGDNAHTVAVDPATHRVFFPLAMGADGTPVLRIMQPSGI